MTAFVQSDLLALRKRCGIPSGNCILNRAWLERDVIVGRVSKDSWLFKSWETVET